MIHAPSVRTLGLIRSGLRKLGQSGLALATLVLGLALSATPASAQEETGVVTGRVLNAQNGMYLSKAVVSVDGTSIEVLTDDAGAFIIRNVPAGERTITASFAGQQPVSAAVTVPAGGSIAKNLQFNRPATAGEDVEVVLAPFEVQEKRYQSAAEIATNEERQSINIKNVVSADSFGFVPDGNLGEFVQFMPGVDVGYGGTYVNENDASSISVRGFGPEDTSIMVDGMAMAGASSASLTRAVGLDMMTVNNASRIEVVKVATPDMPNDSPGGSINLVTRSAFEYARPTYTFDATLALNSMESIEFSKQPGPASDSTFHTLPGLRLAMTWPISDTLGLSASVSSDNKYGPGERYATRFRNTAGTVNLTPIGGANNTPIDNANGQASFANPYLDRASINDQPWNTFKQSGNLKLDWRPFPGFEVSSNLQYSRYTGINVDRRVQFTIGAADDWGADYVRGYQYAVGTGTFNPGHSSGMTITARDKEGDTLTMYLTAKYQRAGWTIDGAAKRSTATSSFEDVKNGHFSGLDLSLTTGRIDFYDIKSGVPGTIALWNRTAAPLDYSLLSNWLLESTVNAQSGEAYSEDIVDDFMLNVRKDLDFMPVPTSVKAGWARRVKDISKWGRGTGYRMRYTGPQLTTTQLMDSYTSDPIFGMNGLQQWASTYKLYDIYEENPEFFDPDFDATYSIANYNSYISQNREVKETSDAVYAMIEASFFDNRVSVMTGVRQKETTREGRQGFVDSKFNYVRLPTGLVYTDSIYTQGVKYDGSTGPLSTGGSYARDAVLTDTALRSRMQAAGVVNIPDQLELSQTVANANGTAANNLNLAMERYKMRDLNVSRRDPATPQVQVAVKITKHLDLKLAWSRETKLQNIEAGTTFGILTAGNTLNINENLTPDGSLGSDGAINISNAALKPEISNSYNAELSYYTNTGGKFSVAYFYKEISNVWDDLQVYNTSAEYEEILTSFGLFPSDFPNWTLNSTINSAGKGTRDGVELDFRQNLGIVGRWARGIDVFVTYSHRPNTKSDIPENPPIGYIQKIPTRDKYTGGVSYSTQRFSLQARAVYLEGGVSRASTFSYRPPGATVNSTYQLYNVFAGNLKLNIETSYQLSERYRIFLSASDVLNSRLEADRQQDVYSGVIPDYASHRGQSHRGVIINFGIGGRF